uniref:Uncharacterized protein n=1 Tax=Romanomermis culicivorax TaxID=13658 RepID=A0A915K4S2_ROMCU
MLREVNNPCQSAAECYLKWAEKSAECNQFDEKLRRIQPYPKNAPQYQMCNAENREKSEQVQAKAAETRKEYAHCVQNRMAEMLPVNPNSVNRCNQAVANYSTILQVNPVPPTSSPAVNNTTISEYQLLNQKLHVCRQEEQALATVCGPLTSCCSENYICSLMCQISKAGNGLAEYKLQYELRSRQCNKLRPTPATSSTTAVAAATVTTILVNSAAAITTAATMAGVSAVLNTTSTSQ